jgi:hypothetical protein
MFLSLINKTKWRLTLSCVILTFYEQIRLFVNLSQCFFLIFWQPIIRSKTTNYLNSESVNHCIILLLLYIPINYTIIMQKKYKHKLLFMKNIHNNLCKWSHLFVLETCCWFNSFASIFSTYKLNRKQKLLTSLSEEGNQKSLVYP